MSGSDTLAPEGLAVIVPLVKVKGVVGNAGIAHEPGSGGTDVDAGGNGKGVAPVMI